VARADADLAALSGLDGKLLPVTRLAVTHVDAGAVAAGVAAEEVVVLGVAEENLTAEPALDASHDLLEGWRYNETLHIELNKGKCDIRTMPLNKKDGTKAPKRVFEAHTKGE
jgi:hypothetical protein